MNLVEFMKFARDLEHGPDHRKRTIVCNPSEVQDLARAVGRTSFDNDFKKELLPTVRPVEELAVGRAFVTCEDCLASRLGDITRVP